MCGGSWGWCCKFDSVNGPGGMEGQPAAPAAAPQAAADDAETGAETGTAGAELGPSPAGYGRAYSKGRSQLGLKRAEKLVFIKGNRDVGPKGVDYEVQMEHDLDD